MARLSQRLVMVASLVLGGLTLSACGRDGLGEARQACTIARAGIHSYEASIKPGVSAADQAALLQQTRSSFVRAMSHAARANSANGRWNALMTSFQTSRRVPVTYVIPTIKRQCASILSNDYLY